MNNWIIMELLCIKKTLKITDMSPILSFPQNDIWILKYSFFINTLTTNYRVIHWFDYKYFSVFNLVNGINCWPIMSSLLESIILKNMSCIVVPHLIHCFRFIPCCIKIILLFHIFIEILSQYFIIFLSEHKFFKLNYEPIIIKSIKYTWNILLRF